MVKKGIMFNALLFFLFSSAYATAQDFENEYNNFVIGLAVNDSAEVSKYFETEDMYNQCKWEIFQTEFVDAIIKVSYSDLKDDYLAGEKIKQHELQMPWEMEEDGEMITIVSVIILYFKETSAGLKMIGFDRPEGTDAP